MEEGFLFGLHNAARAYQTMMKAPIKRLQLKGKQEGLVLTITPSDCIVHWPGSVIVEGSTQLLETTTLPFQQGAPLCEQDDTTEINSVQEVMVIRRPRSLLIPPTPPDVHSSDEAESNISPNAKSLEDETEAQRAARLRKNKMREGHRHRAHQRKEAWDDYEVKLRDYERRRR